MKQTKPAARLGARIYQAFLAVILIVLVPAAVLPVAAQDPEQPRCASRTFTIPGGRGMCTFDISVLFVDDSEECCSMGKPAGTQNLCENDKFIVHD